MENRSYNVQKRERWPVALAAAVVALFLAVAYAAFALGQGEGASVQPGASRAGIALVAAAALLSVWGIAAQHRCTNRGVARLVGALFVLLVVWIGLALAFEFPLGEPYDSIVEQALVLPQIAAPLVFLGCSLRASIPDAPPATRIAMAVATVAAVAVAVFACANGTYGAAPTYAGPLDVAQGTSSSAELFVVVGLTVFLLAGSAIVLSTSPLRKARVKIPTIAGLIALGIAYCAVIAACDSLHCPDVGAIAGAALMAAMVELSIDSGLFPHVQRFLQLFRRLPFDLRIVNFNGRELFRTNASPQLDNTTLRRIAELMPERGSDTRLSTRVPGTAHAIRELYRLSASIAVLTEDASTIDELRARLEERQQSLVNQNKVIASDYEVKATLYRQQRERELAARVEHDLADATARIQVILDSRALAAGSGDQEERIRQLNLVKALIAYSKRKGMLALAATESDVMTRDQVELIAREATADLRSIGIECAVFSSTDDIVDLSAVNAVYDSFYDCILSVLPRSKPVIMTSVSSIGEGDLELRMTVECAIGLDPYDSPDQIPAVATEPGAWTSIQESIAEELEGRLSQRNVFSSVNLDGGLVYATVRTGQGGSR